MRSILLAVVVLARLGGGAFAYEVVDVDRAGRVSGRVVLAGETPGRAFLPVLKNDAVCGSRVPDESLLVGPEGGVAGVVVEIEGVRAGKAPRSGRAVLDNRGCRFVPRVQALVAGQTLELRNSDPILHDAHAWLGPRTIFNLGLPTWRRVERVLRVPGLYEVDCNVLHTWMKAWIYVAEHPYVAVTDPAGRFDLRQVPPGAHSLRLWHERLGEKRLRVSVEPSAEARLEIHWAAPP